MTSWETEAGEILSPDAFLKTLLKSTSVRTALGTADLVLEQETRSRHLQLCTKWGRFLRAQNICLL